MAENTTIAWCDHTWNPVLGCDPVHIGCANCYAQAYFKRQGIVGKRRRTTDDYWKKPLKWNRRAASLMAHREALQRQVGYQPRPERPRVFPSMCDVFEDWQGPILNAKGFPLMRQIVGDGETWRDGAVYVGQVAEYELFGHRPVTMADLRRDMFGLTERCRQLDFIFGTKRPENIERFWPRLVTPEYGGAEKYLRNVWLLYSASNQETLEAGIGHLLKCRDLAGALGLSLEPLLGPITLKPEWLELLNWLIVGAESGPKRRPMDIAWLRDIVDQCKAAGVPIFVKQASAHQPGRQGNIPEALWKLKEIPDGT